LQPQIRAPVVLNSQIFSVLFRRLLQLRIGQGQRPPYLANGDKLSFALVNGPAWLNTTPDGALSGTAKGLNGGTDTFLVSVTDLGGFFYTTIMTVYVNSPPVFDPQTFIEQAATIGVPYFGRIATNATDPDIVAGDFLTFYRVTGRARLDVATNATLSGTPAGTDLGANIFLVLVVDSVGLAGIGSMNVQVNDYTPSVFAANPFTEPLIMAGNYCTATLATNAIVSGPAWLNIAGNGALSGTPLSINACIDAFVVTVTGLHGLSNSATMYVSVTYIPICESILNQGSNGLLGWTGCVPPYQVQTTTNLASPTRATNVLIEPSNNMIFYRIQGHRYPGLPVDFRSDQTWKLGNSHAVKDSGSLQVNNRSSPLQIAGCPYLNLL
jgi:hypothetical protein